MDRKMCRAMARKGSDVEERRKLYEERLVKEIMISTALCIQELLLRDPKTREDDICEFVEMHYHNIIEETISSEIDGNNPPGEDIRSDDF